MPRYEFKDGKSNKFWEIELEEESYTTRWGRIGTDGQETTKEFDSKSEARAEYDKLVASKVKKGYVLVGGGGGPQPAQRNAELEAAVLADLDGVDAYLVYGDWLVSKGDPRGELVAVQAAVARGDADAATRAREAELIAKVAEVDLGSAADLLEGGDLATVQVSYRLGFLHRLRIGFFDWEQYEEHSDRDFADIVVRTLSGPGGAFVRELSLGLNSLEGEADLDGMLRALGKKGPFPTVRSVVVGDFEFPDVTEISWVRVGDVGAVWKAFPNLERLEVQGAEINLGAIHAPALRHLELRTGGLPAQALKSLSKASFPELETLRVWTGSSHYGATSTMKDVAPLLDGRGTPKLKTLGLMNSELANEIAAALPTAKILPQLKELDLSMGTMTDEGGQHVVAAAPAFAHLERLHLHRNYLDATAAVLGTWSNVVLGSQGRVDDYGPYVAVGE